MDNSRFPDVPKGLLIDKGRFILDFLLALWNTHHPIRYEISHRLNQFIFYVQESLENHSCGHDPLLARSLQLEWTLMDQLVPWWMHLLWPLFGKYPKYSQNILKNCWMGTKKAKQPLPLVQAADHDPIGKVCAIGMNPTGPTCAMVDAYFGVTTFWKVPNILLPKYPQELLDGHQEG